MATRTVEEIAVDLVARTERLERRLASAGNIVDRRLGAMEQRGSAFASRFTGALAGVSVIAMAKQFLDIADASKAMEAQLKLATASLGTQAQAQADVQRIARETRAGLKETVSLYGGFVRASAETGRSQGDAARATETFGKALKIGGAGANEAASATLQFNQALQSGTLRGDEFNSIMEASPRIARLLADALGVPIGALRKMAEEGKITSDVLFRALTDQRFTAGVDAEFKQLPSTFADAMTQVQNAAITVFGAFDRGGQFSNALVNFLSTGTDSFVDLAKAAEAEGVNIRATFAGLSDVFEPLLSGAQGVFGGVRAEAQSTRDQIASLLGGLDQLYNGYAKATNVGTRVENAYTRGFNKVFGTSFGQTPLTKPRDSAGQYLAGDRRSRAESRREAAARRLEGLGFEVPRNADGSVNEAGIRRRAQQTRTRPPAPASAGKKKKGPRSPLDPDAFERDEAQLNDRILNARGDQATTAEQAAAIELERINARRAVDVDQIEGDKRFTAVQKLRLKALADLAAAGERAAVIRARDIEVEERTAAALRRERESVEARARDAQDELRARLDIATTLKDRRALALRLLELEQQEERQAQERIIADRQRVLADQNATPDARAAAGADIADARGRLAAQPTRFAVQRLSVERANQGPLAEYRDQLRSAADDMDVALENVAANGLSRMEDGLAGVLDGTKSVADGFKEMTAGIISDLARIAIRKAILGGLERVGLKFSTGGEVPAYAGGGTITGPGTGTSDSILARVSAGEFIVRAEQARRHLPTLEAINSGRVPAYARGGAVRPIDLSQVIPLGQARANPAQGGGTTVMQTVQVDARGAVMNDQFASLILARAGQDARQLVGANNSAARKGLPAAQSRFSQLGTTG